MTREKAIRHFERYVNDDCYTIEHQEACKMAISALREQEERENPLSAFLEPMDSYNGLKRKFLVFKSDTGEMIENCFVLRPDKDTAAVAALRAYAEATDNDTLAADIISWVGAECHDPLTLEELREMDGEPVWIRRCGSDSKDDQEWALIYAGGGFCRTSVGNIAFFALYGIGWLAYRHKPKEGS